MKTNRILLRLTVMVMMMIGLAALQAQVKTVIILHTNDMHAKIDELPKLAYLADSLREQFPHVFLVAAGDNFTGNPVVDMIPDKGFPMIDLMNRCHFDLSVLGNHEFDLGQDFLQKRMDQATFPFICCNIDASGGKIKQPEPYKVLDAGPDVHLAFLGIIQRGDNNLPDAYPAKMEGLKFQDGIKKAGEFAGLKEKYGILIGLTHLGVDADAQLAKEVPAFDLIIGGHSHTLIDTVMIVNGVPIVQAHSGLKYIGKTTLEIEGGKVLTCRNENIPVSRLTGAVPEMVNLVHQYNDIEEMKRVAGYAESPLTGPDELGSMMTDAITHRLKIDFAFQNRGGIRTAEIPAGAITYKEIYKLDPFGNLVVLFSMKPDEIRSLIRNSYNRGKKIDLDVSGMTYTILTDASGTCTDVDMRDPSGKQLPPDREYAVGMNSYVATTYTFEHRDAGVSASVTTAQMLIEYLLEVHTVSYKGTKRTSVGSSDK